MSHLLIQERLRNELGNLVGLRAWHPGLLANMVVISFGERHSTTSRSGSRIELGDYALHIQCAWRLAHDNGIVVGFADWVAEEEEGADRVYDRLQEALSESPRVIELVHVRGGAFSLALEGGLYLETFPSLGEPDPEKEFWRLLRPTESTPHFVVRPSGVSPDVDAQQV